MIPSLFFGPDFNFLAGGIDQSQEKRGPDLDKQPENSLLVLLVNLLFDGLVSLEAFFPLK